MAKHPNQTIVWKLKSLRNWIYNKWMCWRGYKPLEFDFKNNRYSYIREADLEEFVREAEEEAPEYELVGYKKDPEWFRPWWRTEEQQDEVDLKRGHNNALAALREGRDDDDSIVRRSLPRK